MPKITINPTLNLETMQWEGESYEYVGPFLMFKGDTTAQAAETQQNSFDSQLMNVFESQYANQTNTLNYLKGQLRPQISSGGQGYTPAQLTAMRTSASDANTAAFANAQKGVNATAIRAGGDSMPSGVGAQIEGSLAAAEGQQQANSQNLITTQNANLQQSNYWSAINALTGNAQLMNPLGYSGNATSGTNAVANTSEAVTSANGPTAGEILGGIAGGALSGWARGGFKSSTNTPGYNTGPIGTTPWLFTSTTPSPAALQNFGILGMP